MQKTKEVINYKNEHITLKQNHATFVSIIGDRDNRTGMECKTCNKDYHQCGSCNTDDPWLYDFCSASCARAAIDSQRADIEALFKQLPEDVTKEIAKWVNEQPLFVSDQLMPILIERYFEWCAI